VTEAASAITSAILPEVDARTAGVRVYGREQTETTGIGGEIGKKAPSGLRRISLTNFRSYPAMTMALDGRPVTLTGENGAGKTNILEALSLLGPGRGLRGARLNELARLEGDGAWAVSVRYDDGEDERALGVGASANAPDRRQCRIDGQTASGPTAFTSLMRFLWLTPAQDRLFMEGASERRRFFDRMVAAHDPGFSKTASAYEQAMRQRQKLLEAGTCDEAWLSALEQQMAEYGVALADARRAMALTLVAQDVSGTDGLFPSADIALEGELEAALVDFPACDVEDDFIERLRSARNLDREAGRALRGPHRSDLIVGHRPKGRPARLCSTGEQKALLIGLVLANAKALANRRAGNGYDRATARDRAPLILLLDEIAAHLDADRRACLFDILEGLAFPVFMTGTDRSLFAAWGGRAQQFDVCNGEVRVCEGSE